VEVVYTVTGRICAFAAIVFQLSDKYPVSDFYGDWTNITGRQNFIEINFSSVSVSFSFGYSL